jgi:hypothetical protein
MISYRVSHAAKLWIWPGSWLQQAGVESLSIEYGDDGNIQFQYCAYCWLYKVESYGGIGPNVQFNTSFRDQLDTSYVHVAAWPVPGGAGYLIDQRFDSAEMLMQNNIILLGNKVMTARGSGAGSVIAYNYTDMGYILGSCCWQEIGLNASHLVGPHHVLFEGNWGFNMDSDATHGGSDYITYFRNWSTAIRSPFTALNGDVYNDAAKSCGTTAYSGSPLRATGPQAYSYWFSFIGNVLGTPNCTTQANGYRLTNSYGGPQNSNSIFFIGWWNGGANINDPQSSTIYPSVPAAIATNGYGPASCTSSGTNCATIVDGNYNYWNNQQQWNQTPFTLPNSLYLNTKPAYFDSGSGYTWPWVTPENRSTPIQAGPAIGGGPSTPTSYFNPATNLTLSPHKRTATNGTNTGNYDYQVNDTLSITGVSGDKVYYEMGCAGTTGNGGTGYANAFGMADWLGKNNNSAGFVLGNSGANNYQAGGVYTSGQWGGCVTGDTIGVLLDATVTPMTLAVEVLHSGAWGSMTSGHNLPSGLTSSGTLIPTADVKATGEAYTICGNATCAASPSGIPTGAVWFDSLVPSGGATNYSGLPAKARWEACQPTPIASCIMTQP